MSALVVVARVAGVGGGAAAGLSASHASEQELGRAMPDLTAGHAMPQERQPLWARAALRGFLSGRTVAPIWPRLLEPRRIEIASRRASSSGLPIRLGLGLRARTARRWA